jgi:ribosome maturation factor RimP
MLYNQWLTTIRAGTDRPFFLVELIFPYISSRAAPYRPVVLQNVVQQVVTGLGYELVEIERSAGGLLRITIDWPWAPGAAEPQFITVEDCERVTRQLQFALEVEGVDYRRLEVSSPGIDRPLRGKGDFERYQGSLVDVVLKAPIGKEAAGVAGLGAGRKKFRGVLERVDGPEAAPGRWRIVWSDEPAVKPGAKVGKRRRPVTLQALEFALDELREARLAPVVDFKGRGSKPAELPPTKSDVLDGRQPLAADDSD